MTCLIWCSPPARTSKILPISRLLYPPWGISETSGDVVVDPHAPEAQPPWHPRARARRRGSPDESEPVGRPVGPSGSLLLTLNRCTAMTGPKDLALDHLVSWAAGDHGGSRKYPAARAHRAGHELGRRNGLRSRSLDALAAGARWLSGRAWGRASVSPTTSPRAWSASPLDDLVVDLRAGQHPRRRRACPGPRL